jgi:glycosyltransferase involved in cell wall biosynthesis
MARITLLCPNQLSSTPRILRNANALAKAGHQVTLVWPDHLERYLAYDAKLIAESDWQSQPIDFVSTPSKRLLGLLSRTRRKIADQLSHHNSSLWLTERAYGYFGPELTRAVVQTRPQFVLAQQQTVLAPAARAARLCGALFAIDVEDLLSESQSEPVHLIQRVESAWLPQAAFVCTMSEAAADFLNQQHRLKQPPLILHNCPRLVERGNLKPPVERNRDSSILRLYWFGQTIGPHSCAESILRAMHLLKKKTMLTLRGFVTVPSYIESLQRLAHELHLSDSLKIEPGASPEKMVELAAEHDVCFGTQPGLQLFHRLAIGNKVFTGMMAGCVVALTHTPAHQRLLDKNHDWAFHFGENNPEQLAAALQPLLDQPNKRLEMQQHAWDLATSTYHWELESEHLVQHVSAALSQI